MKPTRRGFLKGLGAIAAGAVVNESIALPHKPEFKHKAYSKGFVVEEYLTDPDAWFLSPHKEETIEWTEHVPYARGPIITSGQAAARAMRITKEVQGADVFNAAFGEGYKNLHWEEIN